MSCESPITDVEVNSVYKQQLNMGYGTVEDCDTEFDKIGLHTFADGIFNVKSFGALGDGVTDDTDAIMLARDAANALPGGGTVFFPSGTYLLDYSGIPGFEAFSNYYISTVPIRIIGAGIKTTVIKNLSATAGLFRLNFGYSTISDLTLDNNSSTGHCLQVYSQYCEVKNVRIVNSAGSNFGLFIDGSTLSVFNNIIIDTCTNGMMVGQSFPTNYCTFTAISISTISGDYCLRSTLGGNLRFFGLYVEVGQINSILFNSCQEIDIYSLGSELSPSFAGTAYFKFLNCSGVHIFGARINHDFGTATRTIFLITGIYSEGITFDSIWFASDKVTMTLFQSNTNPKGISVRGVWTRLTQVSCNGFICDDTITLLTIQDWYDSNQHPTHTITGSGVLLLNVAGTIAGVYTGQANAAVFASGTGKTVDQLITAMQVAGLIKQV